MKGDLTMLTTERDNLEKRLADHLIQQKDTDISALQRELQDFRAEVEKLMDERNALALHNEKLVEIVHAEDAALAHYQHEAGESRPLEGVLPTMADVFNLGLSSS